MEHITALVEERTDLDRKGKTKWFKELKGYVRKGELQRFQQEVTREAKKHQQEELTRKLTYFEKRSDKMQYNVYEANHQPIGSRAVESAIRRVINLRLKSPSSFWKPEHLEKILILRCALKAGRWKIVMSNFVQSIRLKLPEE